MLSKGFSLLFYLKKPKNYVRGKLPIYMRITIDATRVELSIQRESDPERWNSHAGRVNGNKEEIKSINSYLDSLQARFYEAHRNLIDNKESITVLNIKNKLRGVTERSRMIIEIFEHHNNQVAQLIGKDFSKGTLARFKTSLDHTRNFIAWKYNLPDLDITKLNYEFISEYAFWLKSIRNCNHNSTMKYLANFKKIVLICLKNGWPQKDPFLGFKLAKQEVERAFLTQQELQELASKEFSNERLVYVRDIFLFSCFTGLAYADVKKLKRTEIAIGVDGEKRVFTRRQKTNTSSRIPLLSASLEIVNRYQDHPQCVNKRYTSSGFKQSKDEHIPKGDR